MANIINGTDTGSGGLITTGDSSDELQLQTAETARVTLTNTAVVVNETGADVDFRVEGDTDANLLFVDASTDRVGIGTDAPAAQLHVSGTAPIARLTETDNLATATNARIDFYGSDARSGYVGTSSGDLEVWMQQAKSIQFGTANAERMRITSAGEVLVGGTTEIDASSGNLTIQKADFAPHLNLFRNDTTVSSGTPLGIINFYGNDTTSNTPTIHAYIDVRASGGHAAGDNPTDIIFGCTNDGSSTVDEFARLGQGGSTERYFKVTQATVVDNQGTYVGASAGTAGTVNRDSRIGVFKHGTITNACAYILLDPEDGTDNYIWVDNSDVLRISTTAGNIGTTSGTVVGTQTSDERLKDISGPVSYGLSEVLAIEPIAFTMKDDASIPKIGFSAQQVQPIVPEAVYDTKECIDGYTENEETKEQIANSDRTKLAMEYTQLIPVLVNAVKELKAELDEAKARIAALEGN